MFPKKSVFGPNAFLIEGEIMFCCIDLQYYFKQNSKQLNRQSASRHEPLPVYLLPNILIR